MAIFHRNKGEPEVEAEAVIDLRLPDDAPAPPPQWGSPLPCPSCAGRGYLDHIDPYRQIMYLHCTECLSKYEVSRADLESGSASSV